MNRATKNCTQKTKLKSLNINEKTVAEFYIELTLAMHF